MGIWNPGPILLSGIYDEGMLSSASCMTKFHILRRFKFLKKGQWVRGEHESYGFYHDRWLAELDTNAEFRKKYPKTVAVRCFVTELYS